MVTTLTFDANTVVDNDLIVLVDQSAGCSTAHQSISTTTNSLAITSIASGSVDTTTTMTAGNTLSVCFATSEAGGHTAGDWVELQDGSGASILLYQQFPITFGPNRLVVGVTIGITISGGQTNDKAAWTTAADCSSVSNSASATQTPVYTISGVSHTVVLNNDLGTGVFKLCYQPDNTDASGSIWTHVTGRDLTMVTVPSSSPLAAIAGMATPITMSGSGGATDIQDGDFVVLQPDDCANAHLAATGTDSLQSTGLVSSQVFTDTAMVDSVTLVVCFASSESLGDSADDYVNAGTLTQLPPPTFVPHRTISAHQQVVRVSGGNNGDKVTWNKWSEACAQTPASPSSEQTDVFDITSSAHDVTLGDTLIDGEWRTCYKPAGGRYSHLTTLNLTVFSVSMSPVTAVAG